MWISEEVASTSSRKLRLQLGHAAYIWKRPKRVGNSLRVPAVGRRRWLHIGHPAAGWRRAVIDSLTVSCRRRRINPQEYLTDVLRRLLAMNITQIGELLPACWKPAPPTNA